MPLSTRQPDIGASAEKNPRFLLNVILSSVVFVGALALAYMPGVFDFPLTRLANGYAGKNPLVDLVFFDLDSCASVSGAVMMALVWECWFSKPDAEARSRILAGVTAAFLASLISRGLQRELPTHFRPFYDTALHFHIPLFVSSTPLNTWYSFPSDHAAVFFGLLVVIWQARSRFRFAALPWIAIVESARTYMGAHYPSDLIGAAGLASAFVWASQSPYVLRVARRAMRSEQAFPAVFYMAAFFISFQLATLFVDVRNISGGFWELAHHRLPVAAVLHNNAPSVAADGHKE